MANDDFAIDPRNKFGNADWEDGDEFAAFVDALNRGVTVRPSVPGAADAGGEIEATPADLAELRARLASYH